MQSASLSTIKNELQHIPQEALVELCLRIAKYKKENKELLNYLLFENTNEQHYINAIKQEIEEQFAEINISNMFFAKKSIRRILRMANKYIKYSGLAETEIEVLIHFCKQVKALKIDYTKSAAMVNLYNNQLKKINKAMNTLHEDLQYEYEKEIELLS
ncbi:MAG TPA: hypothetical protein PLS10_02205 [Chitinophagales bacterium]|nr:hypothetical protein [Chitinophagales bacterium]